MKRCRRMRLYGYPQGQPSRCRKHKLVRMVNLVFVCAECPEEASYGYKEFQASRCKEHKEEGMHYCMRRACAHDQCHKTPSFNISRRHKAKYCHQHKTEGMVNVNIKPCKLCKAVGINSKYKPYCARCFFWLHPSDPRCRSIQTKERHFTIKVKELFPQTVLDKAIAGGCSKRRPDCLIDVESHSIIVEVDENQHQGYEDSCENKRIMEIFKDLGNRPLVVIRINPDRYQLDGVDMGSCFDKKNALKPKQFEERFHRLVQEVEYHISNIPQREITICKLFYTE